MITKVARPLDNNLMAHRLDTSIPQGLTATTQSLDDLMACGQSNGAIIQANVLDTIQKP